MPRDETAPITTDRFLQHVDGLEVTRMRTCSCGREFKQSLLSDRFLAYCERRGIAESMAKNTDGGYVPAFCPVCERKEVGQLERMATYGRSA